MTNGKLPSERLFKHHRRQWQLYLLFCVVMAIGTIIAILLPREDPEIVLVPAVLVFALMFALHLIERARNAEEYQEELRRINYDEWMIASRNRSLRLALLTVIFGQVPLMFFMSLVPPEPSVAGMGMMTTALGCGVFAAGYLFHGRERADE